MKGLLGTLGPGAREGARAGILAQGLTLRREIDALEREAEEHPLPPAGGGFPTGEVHWGGGARRAGSMLNGVMRALARGNAAGSWPGLAFEGCDPVQLSNYIVRQAPGGGDGRAGEG